MNIFGSLTFGSLIKTLLPGFVWLVAIGIFEADVSQCLGYKPYIWKALVSKEQAATLLVLAFPAAILLGLLSNILVFMGLNDCLVRKPVRAAKTELFALHDHLSAAVREQCWTALGWTDLVMKKNFEEVIDPEIIIIERVGAEKLSYVREQYWFHLEFQLNLLISLAALFLALAVSVFINTAATYKPLCAMLLIFATLIVVLTIGLGLLKAARKNYIRHVEKMASLLAAMLSSTPKGEAGGSR